MREIKFRAVNPETGVMHSNVTVPTNEGWILMQFTGLHDKNGVEIFEGDVLTGVWGYENAPFEIRWDLYGFRLRSIQDNLIGPQADINWCKKDEWINCPTHIDLCEVIGNIYENPEIISKDEQNGL